MCLKIIISGSRTITDTKQVFKILKESAPLYKFFNARAPVNRSQRQNVQITQGDCPKGVDSIARDFAYRFGFALKSFPANWDKHGKAAGPIRNRQMAREGDILIAVWDGVSRGTRNMIDEMLKQKKEVHIYVL